MMQMYHALKHGSDHGSKENASHLVTVVLMFAMFDVELGLW